MKRFISAIEKKSPVPQEILDKAGPAPSIFDKAAKQGMDLAEVASKYKEYVESGAVEKVGFLKSVFYHIYFLKRLKFTLNLGTFWSLFF